jgi:hypothetical protein
MAEYSEDLKEHVLVERRFLHDLSNMLLISQGMASFVKKKLNDNPETDSTIIDKLDKSLNAMDRMIDSIKEHRALLHQINSD